MASIVSVIKKYYPEVNIVEKKSSWFMKAIAAIMFWQTNAFMTNYWTTIGNTIYVVSLDQVEQDPARVLHEIVHVMDRNRNIFYSFLYLLPFPFLFRANYEKKAYLAQCYANKRINPSFDVASNWKEIVDYNFHSAIYLWMNPFQGYDLPAELISDPFVKLQIDTMLNEYLGV